MTPEADEGGPHFRRLEGGWREATVTADSDQNGQGSVFRGKSHPSGQSGRSSWKRRELCYALKTKEDLHRGKGKCRQDFSCCFSRSGGRSWLGIGESRSSQQACGAHLRRYHCCVFS